MLSGTALALAATGVVILLSGLKGSPVQPIAYHVVLLVWFLVPAGLLLGFAAASRGWPAASAILLFLATRLVAALTYELGPYDSQPWWGFPAC